MPSPYDELVEFVAQSGISQAEAEHAVRRCATAMLAQGAATYVAGSAVMYFMNMTIPSAFSYGTLALGAGAVHAVAKSPQCSEVREAIRFWNTNTF
jgi:hypothetical protein